MPREHQPLLCEQFSDEEQLYRCHRHQRLLHLRSHTRKRLKGAVNIIAQWPGHWSLVKSIWLMFGLFVILIMILYNALVSMNTTHITGYDWDANSVFIHFFSEKINEELYLSHLKSITEEFPNFNYQFILLTNDTTEKLPKHEDYYDLDDYQMKRKHLETFLLGEIKNSYVREISLENFMEQSPLKSKWRSLAPEFLPFLIRAISVWNHGGISINPLIVTPASPNQKYEKKLKRIFNRFINDSVTNEPELPGYDTIGRPTRRYNNIQDIIEAIEKEPFEKLQVNLTEAESMTNTIQRKLLSIEPNASTKSLNKISYLKSAHPLSQNRENEMTIFENLKVYFNDIFQYPIRRSDRNVTNKFPMFIDLFTYPLSHNLTESKPSLKLEFPTTEINSGISTKNKFDKRDVKAEENTVLKVNNQKATTLDNEKKITENKLNIEKPNIKIFVDLKGNILASTTPCHAFLGSIFTRIGTQRMNETLKTFLTSEISYFCNGRLSQCASLGLDYFLL